MVKNIEMRRYPRNMQKHEMMLSLPNEKESFVATVCNSGLEGMYAQVETESCIPPGSKIWMQAENEHETKIGTVIWSKNLLGQDLKSLCGMGIRFE